MEKVKQTWCMPIVELNLILFYLHVMQTFLPDGCLACTTMVVYKTPVPAATSHASTSSYMTGQHQQLHNSQAPAATSHAATSSYIPGQYPAAKSQASTQQLHPMPVPAARSHASASSYIPGQYQVLHPMPAPVATSQASTQQLHPCQYQQLHPRLVPRSYIPFQYPAATS
jgi:hypothetical protein